MSDGWGTPDPIYYGDALVDLHGGKGTTWRKEARGYWPDCCDEHRPKAVIREREERERRERKAAVR